MYLSAYLSTIFKMLPILTRATFKGVDTNNEWPVTIKYFQYIILNYVVTLLSFTQTFIQIELAWEPKFIVRFRI